MNFETIKAGFITYLEQKEAEKTGEYVPFDENKKVSIFAHSSEFKDYLMQENIADSTISNISLNEILSMQLVDGKLVKKEPEPEEFSGYDTEESEETQEENSDEDLMSAIINEMMQDEQVVSALDADFSGDLDIDEVQGYFNNIANEQGEISFDSIAMGVQNIYQTENFKEEMYQDSDVITMLDIDGDGTLSDEEKKQFEGFVKGDNDTITLEDLQTVYNAIKEGNFEYFVSTDPLGDDVEENILQTETETQNVSKESTPVSSTGRTTSTGGGYGNYSNTSVKQKSLEEKTYEEMTVAELETVKPKKEQAVKTAQDNLAMILQGQDEDIQKMQTAYDLSQQNILALVEDNQKEEISNTYSAISDKEKEIATQKQLIQVQNSKITNQNYLIQEDKAVLMGLENALSGLPDVSQYSDNPEKQQEIKDKKLELESLIAQAKAKKEQDEKILNETLNPKLQTLEEELDKLENEDLKGLNDKKTELENTALSNNPALQGILDDSEQIKESLEGLKETKLQQAKAALEIAQADLDKLNEQLCIKKQEKTQRDNSLKNKGEEMIELARTYAGNNEASMRQIIRGEGYQFDDGLWCADFATFITAMTYGKDSTPGDFYNSCANTAYCPTIDSWAKEHDVFTTDSSQVQPGDFILYNHNGRAGHIGIVTGVNADGSVNTIEGNTYKSGQRGSYVNEHYNVTNWRGFVLMSSDNLS
ncbi:MAG: CHAP domain-containing protein [Candidatus Gastranaerophilales bacterium]|nr:CHAP domain-containing protein [Candidatus Gastranaerophilales bacterium]